VVGLAGLLDLGYVAFFALGAYFYALLASPFFGQHWPLILLLPLAMALAALAGVLLGIPVLRMRGDYLAIVTLAFGEILRLLLLNLVGLTGGPNGVVRIDRPALAGMRLEEVSEFYYFALASAFLATLVTERLRRSRIGRAWEALREDEEAARAQGIAHVPYKLLAFGIGAAFGGLGGVIFAFSQGSIFPSTFTLDVSIKVLSIIIIGGMGSVPGAVLGSFLIVGLPEVLRDVSLGPLRPADYRLVLFGALLVAFMIWRPAGLCPSPRRRVEFE
jgi:branched-chain amino acid transport system permease protein